MLKKSQINAYSDRCSKVSYKVKHFSKACYSMTFHKGFLNIIVTREGCEAPSRGCKTLNSKNKSFPFVYYE